MGEEKKAVEISEELENKIRSAALAIDNVIYSKYSFGKAEDISHVVGNSSNQYRYGYIVSNVISTGLGLNVYLISDGKEVQVEMGSSGYMKMLKGTPEEFLEVYTEIKDPSLPHKISYDPNGGVGILEPTITKFNRAEKLSDGKDIKAPEGLKLESWNTLSDGTGTEYKLGQEKVKFYEDVVLHAIYGKGEEKKAEGTPNPKATGDNT